MTINESPGKVSLKTLQRILIIENSYRVGIGLFIAKLFRNENFPSVNVLIIDSDEVIDSLASFNPDVVILDVDSLRHFIALNSSITIRSIKPEQVIIFASDRPNPTLVKEGMVAALWSRAYWLNQPSSNPSQVLPEIMRAFLGRKSLNHDVLEAAVTETNHVGRLSPQQHRVMRLMSAGASNGKIAKECGITPKAVERTISAASKLLKVDPSSQDTNHRVNAANMYRRSMLFADPDELD